MVDTPLSHERILESAEQVLRRFGPEKATVVDVARALDVTHGSVYRYFASKAALRDAVVKRWLDAMMPPLNAILAEKGSASARLFRWVRALMAAKHSRAMQEPELFAAYMTLARESREVVRAHVDELVAHLSEIIRDGIEHGEFTHVDPSKAGRAVLLATTRFHHPAHASEWTDPAMESAFGSVWSLLMYGLRADKSTHSP